MHAGPSASVFTYAAAQVKAAMDATARLGGANYVFWCAVAPHARQQPLSVPLALWALSGMPGCRVRPRPRPVGTKALFVCLVSDMGSGLCVPSACARPGEPAGNHYVTCVSTHAGARGRGVARSRGRCGRGGREGYNTLLNTDLKCVPACCAPACECTGMLASRRRHYPAECHSVCVCARVRFQ